MKRCIVLASGWANSSVSMFCFSRRFQGVGYDVLIARYPAKGLGCISKSAQALAGLTRNLDPYYSDLIYLGHSMGGLVTRYAIQKLGVEPSAYCSLGTPHGGSKYAKYGSWFSKSAKQMEASSDLLLELDDLHWPGDLPSLSVSAEFDLLVDKDSAVLPYIDEEEHHIHVPEASHVSMLLDPRVFLEVWAWLTYEVFEEDGPSDREGYSSVLNLDHALSDQMDDLIIPE